MMVPLTAVSEGLPAARGQVRFGHRLLEQAHDRVIHLMKDAERQQLLVQLLGEAVFLRTNEVSDQVEVLLQLQSSLNAGENELNK